MSWSPELLQSVHLTFGWLHALNTAADIIFMHRSFSKHLRFLIAYQKYVNFAFRFLFYAVLLLLFHKLQSLAILF